MCRSDSPWIILQTNDRPMESNPYSQHLRRSHWKPGMLELAHDGLLARMYKSKMHNEQRIFTRVPYHTTVQWSDAQGETGTADVVEVSRGGLSLSLTRYLRPGPALILTFDGVLYRGLPVEVPALTVWCRPLPDDHGLFLAGFSVVHGQPETLGAISEVFYAALQERATGHVG